MSAPETWLTTSCTRRGGAGHSTARSSCRRAAAPGGSSSRSTGDRAARLTQSIEAAVLVGGRLVVRGSWRLRVLRDPQALAAPDLVRGQAVQALDLGDAHVVA